MESSDPSSSTEEMNKSDETHEPQQVIEENEEAHSEVVEIPSPLVQSEKAHPIALLVMLDLFIPILLLLQAITTLSIAGIVMGIILDIHVLLVNQSKRRIYGIKIILYIEFILSIAILIFTIIMLTEGTDNSLVLRFAGLDFRNCVSDGPIFALVSSALSIVFVFIALVLCQEAKMIHVRAYQRKLFHSEWCQYVADLFWVCCLAYIGAATSSALYIPLLIYFVYTSITQSITGRPLVHYKLAWIVYIYSIVYALFIIYQISPIGERYSFGRWIGWLITAPRRVDALLAVICILFTYCSMQMMSSPGANTGRPKKVPLFMRHLSDLCLVFGFIAVYLYALFYPNYLSLLWLLVVYVSSFWKIHALRLVFFRLMTFVFGLSFVAIALTSYATFNVHQNDLMHAFGLFIYKENFNFLIFGFYIMALFAQIGRILNIPDMDQTTVEVEASRAVQIGRQIVRVLIVVIRYCAIGAMAITGICDGLYRDRFAFQIVFVIFLLVVLLQLYWRWVFYVIQALIGLLILANCFFMASLSISEITFHDLAISGLRPENGYILFTYVWTLSLIFLLAIIVTREEKVFIPPLPHWGKVFVFVLTAACHLILVFVAKTTIFTILYLYTAIGIIASLFLESNAGLLISRLCSSLFVSCQLVLYVFTHFDHIRNLISAIIPKHSIVDLSEEERPDFQAAIMAVCLFLGSIGFNEQKIPPKEDAVSRNLWLEARNISRNFFFYISWIFLFGFAVVNEYPTFIKFLFLLFFLFGSASANVFIKIRRFVLLFALALLGCQVCLQIFSYEDSHSREIMSYVGLYFAEGYATDHQRNNSIGWLLAFILLAILNAGNEEPYIPNQQFQKRLYMRLFNAVCACLHHWLPVIVQIALVISSLYNPSVFGWLSFIVLMLVVFKDSLLAKSVLIVTIIFNLTFVVQYLLWLGCPRFLFYFRLDGIINEWGRFLGIVDVTRTALIANCISALIFTFYLQYHLMFVDYKQAYYGLPYVLKGISTFISTYIFEIIFPLTVIIAEEISTFDALFFVIVGNTLYFCTVTFDYEARKSMTLMSWYTFCVIGARIFSRLPVFIQDGKGHSVFKAFDLPFSGQNRIEHLWIVVFALQRFCLHLMKSDIYKEGKEMQIKHSAYKFIRSRQITIAAKMDQEILQLKHSLELDQMKSVSEQSIDELYKTMRMHEQIRKKKLEALAAAETISEKPKWYQKFYQAWIVPSIDRFIVFMARTYPLNSEAGINVLTLQTTMILMQKEIKALEQGKFLNLDRREMEFLHQLPPSFLLHFNSLADLLDFKFFSGKKRMQYFWQDVLLMFRRIALPLLVLMSVIYMFVKPYIWSMILFMYLILFICSMNVNGHPAFLRIMLVIAMVILTLRSCANVTVIENLLLDATKTIDNLRMKIPLLNLIGLEPSASSAIEILVYLSACFLAVDYVATATVFPPEYYYNKYKSVLPGFPEDYCYGIINRPADTFALSAKSGKFADAVGQSMKQLGLTETHHTLWMMFVDFISFLVLLICWNRWTRENDSTGDITQKFTFSFDVGFIFILIVHVLFMFACYFCIVSYRFIYLFFIHSVWLLYTILLSFFFIQSQARSFPGSLKFYLVLRFFVHLMASHQCVVGRRYIAFRYPNFVKDGTYISWMNTFVRVCPFAFEIQTLFLWMAQTTYVPLTDFFVVCDIKQQVECLMVEQADPEYDIPYRTQHTHWISGFLLLVLLILLFGPLFFMVRGSLSTVPNPPLSAKLEVGITSFPPFWVGYASVTPMTQAEHQELARVGKDTFNSLVIADLESLSILDFESSSGQNWVPSAQDNHNIMAKLKDPRSRLVPYYRFKIVYTYPTSCSSAQEVIFQRNGEAMSEETKLQLLEAIKNSTDPSYDVGVRLPLALLMPTTSSMSELKDARQTIALELRRDQGRFWQFTMESGTDSIGFLESVNSYRCIMWSQPVDSSNIVGQFIKSSGGMSGIYILIVITLGEVIRERTLAFIEDLWIERMEKPAQLYRMILAATAFRIGKEPQKEKEMTEKLLDTLRSQERVLKLTSEENVII